MLLRRASAALILLLFFTRLAAGSISSPDSHAHYSADGKRILVMVSPNPSWDQTPEFMLQDGTVIMLRNVFPKSGCYDATTLAPMWQVNWFAFEGQLRTSTDFTYLVRLHPQAMAGGPALDFYTNGNLVRSHTCRDLLKHLNSTTFVNFTCSGWHHEWYDWHASSYQQTGNNRLYLSTGRRIYWIFQRGHDLGYQEHYTFDLATGEIRDVKYTGIDRLIILGLKLAGFTIALPLLLAWLFRRLLRRIRAWRIPAGHCRNCGYDLKANVSGICPECGTRPENGAAPSTILYNTVF